MSEVVRLSCLISELSRWVDLHNAGRDSEAATWARIAKITEEAGEVVSSYIGVTGQNPRKGITHGIADVEEELLDVAIAALTALEHVRGNDGSSAPLLEAKLSRVLARTISDGQRTEEL